MLRRELANSLNPPAVIVVESSVFKPTPAKKRCKGCSNYFSEYCQNTTIHGFKYLGEQERSLAEKVWWCIILALSLYFCIDLIKKTTIKWISSPILVGFKQNPIPVWKVPFPAITICPMVKARQSVFNYSDKLDKYYKDKGSLTAEELHRMQELSLVCNDRVIQGGNDYFTEESLTFLQEVGPDFSNITRYFCTWRKEIIDCNEYFTPTLTDEGICYTFNMLDRKDIFKDNVVFNKHYMSHNKSIEEWDFVKGYSNNASLEAFPYRDVFMLKKNNMMYGFTSLLTVTEEDVDYSCTGLEQGFKVFFHHPAEVLLGGEQYVLTPLKYDVLVTVKPEMMTTSEELKNYSPEVRECFYPHEKELAFFKIYTKKNCEMECLSNYTKAVCGCVAFYMPRTEETKMCGPRKIACMNYVRDVNMAYKEAFNYDEEYIDNLMRNDFRKSKRHFLEFEGKLKDINKNFDINSCHCRPSCTAVRYDLKTEIQTIDWKNYMQRMGYTNTTGETFVNFGAIYYNNKIIASERKELFGIIELIGNCGGILGLFTGFSFLSGVEILYYLTLRAWCNLKQSGRISGKDIFNR